MRPLAGFIVFVAALVSTTGNAMVTLGVVWGVLFVAAFCFGPGLILRFLTSRDLVEDWVVWRVRREQRR